jgi:hypothetical protein
MLSYQMEKDTIDGKKTIIQNPTDKQRQEHEKVIQNILYLIENIFTKKIKYNLVYHQSPSLQTSSSGAMCGNPLTSFFLLMPKLLH